MWKNKEKCFINKQAACYNIIQESFLGTLSYWVFLSWIYDKEIRG